MSQRPKKFRVGGGCPQDGLRCGAQEASLWWTCRAICSSETRKSKRGRGERQGQKLPAHRQCPGDGGCPRGDRPHLCAVPLMKPEAPSLGKDWHPGREQSWNTNKWQRAAPGLSQGADRAGAPLRPVMSPVTTQLHGLAPARGLQVTRLLRLLPAARHRSPAQRSCSSGRALSLSQAARARVTDVQGPWGDQPCCQK